MRRSATPTPRRELPLLLAVPYGLFTLVAFVAWLTVGDTWWTQPINLTTFWWSLPGVLLAPLVLLAGWRRSAALLTIPAVLWLWSYGTAFVPAAPDAGADLRIATYNIYAASPDISHVVALVERQDPDVLLLQEVFPERQAAIEDQLGDEFAHREAIESPGGIGSLMVLSTWPITRVTDVGDASTRSRHTAVVTLDVDGRGLQVVPVHLISPCPSCGTSILERLELEGDVRRAEIGSVLAALDPALPAVVGGDLNSNDRSDPYRQLVAAGFDDPQRAAGRGLGLTWPADTAWAPWLRIDWIMIRGLTAVDAVVGGVSGSDHRPVVVDVAFPS